MITKWQLPFHFDPQRLKDDLAKIAPDEWESHFNTSYYEGDWSGVALRAVPNAAMQLYPDPTATGAFADTEILARCPYLQAVLATFQCELESVRLLKLRAGSQILEHRDYRTALEDGIFRVHVPIVTSPAVGFYLQGQRLDMREGETWYLNLNLPHRVDNQADIDRVHLVIDGVVNDWMRALIPEQANDSDEVAAATPVAEPTASKATEVRQPSPEDRAATARIAQFLEEIGIKVRFGPLPEPGFLPGVLVEPYGLLVDEAQLLSPGDLLHEAGHIAVVSPGRRAGLEHNVGTDQAEEMMAIGWSYAAALHIPIDPALVFHATGYRGGSNSMLENFAQGHYVGVPMLQWVGMTLEPRPAQEQGLQPYPHMLHWLRQA